MQNYIDDTGVQVADVVVGFQTLEQASLDEVRALAAAPRFDYYCWDLYARVTEWYEADKTRLAVRQQALHDIEHGGNPTAEMGAFVADAIVRRHLETMRRLNIEYDLLTWEGDILRLKFWAHAFEILKQQGTVYFQTEGRLAGCWVMAIDDGEAGEPGESGESGEAGRARARRGRRRPRESHRALQRHGHLRRQGHRLPVLEVRAARSRFQVPPLRHPGRRPAAVGDDVRAAHDTPGHPPFGGAGTTYNVIDVRQSYLQKLLKQALAAMGHTRQAERSIHFSYEMVALSHATARVLGYAPPAEDARSRSSRSRDARGWA